eukprot:606945-Prorocentrum_minimum.AAC.1
MCVQRVAHVVGAASFSCRALYTCGGEHRHALVTRPPNMQGGGGAVALSQCPACDTSGMLVL